MKKAIPRETNPVWIKYYADRLLRLLIKLEHLDPDHKMYWPKKVKILHEVKQIEGKLGIRPNRVI